MVNLLQKKQDLAKFENDLVQANNNFHVHSKIKENLEKGNLDFIKQTSNIETEIDTLKETKMLLETLKVYKLKEKKDFILGIVNSAIADIFQDNIRIAIEPQEISGKSSANGNQKFDIIFYQNDIELARNDELLISNGGGIMQVISMLFKLLIGFIYSKNTFYMFDESFSQLSSDNRIRLSKFLQLFCEKYNFTIVVVSQVLDLDEYADIVYSVNASYNDNGVRTLVLEDTIIKEGIMERNVKEGEEGLWKIDISNFQSISNISLTFKGYTVIRGPNNSGKSAILRAISSILYNSFNVKKFPRKAGGLDTKGNPSKKLLNTEIKLTKVMYNETSAIEKWVGLRYKSNKVSFLLEGEEYFGKNLASEKLMEKIEDIGFKYINLKEFYKNFKGNLKDQTERIASTTQYDGLFLVGAKGNETEKIFNFLFNTENITKAIIKIRDEMVILGKEYENIQARILENVSAIELSSNNIIYYYKLYYLHILNNLHLFGNQLKIDLDKIKVSIADREKVIELDERNKLLLRDGVSALASIKENILALKKEANLKNNTIVSVENNLDIYTKAKDISIKINNLSDALFQLRKLKNSKNVVNVDTENRIYLLTHIIFKLEQFKKLNSFLNEMSDITRKTTNLELYLEPVYNSLQLINDKYHLSECSCCSGKGFIPYINQEKL